MNKAVKFLNSTIEELKLVEWLSKSELVKYSWMVLVFMIVLTISIGFFDIFLAKTRGVSVCVNEDNFTACAKAAIKGEEYYGELEEEPLLTDTGSTIIDSETGSTTN